MNKNTKKNTSARKKLIPAIGMLMISGSMLATSTYAWFTMNKTVSVDGMALNTVVGKNLMISDTNQSDAYYGTHLTQTIDAQLEPVSTVSALDGSYFYTTDAKPDGSKLHALSTNPYTAYDATNTTLFNTSYGTTGAVGYVDYVFYLKATGDSQAAQALKMTKCDLSYNDAAITDSPTDKAWRIAVFATNTTVGTTSAVPVANGNLKGGSILARPSSANHDGKAVSDTDATTAINYTNSGVVIDTVAIGATNYYKVDIRIWLEGEDTTCTSQTYAQLTNDWKLDVEFTLGESDSAVTTIGTAAKASKTDDVPRPATP